MDVKNKLVHFYKDKFESEKRHLDLFIPWITSAVEEYNRLQIVPLLAEEVSKLIEDPVLLIAEKITSGTPTTLFNGLPVAKRNIFNLVEKPALFDEVVNRIQELKIFMTSRLRTMTILKDYSGEISLNKLLSYYTFDDFSNIKISEEHLKLVEGKYELFCRNKGAEKIYEFALALLEKAKELDINDVLIKSGSLYTNWKIFMSHIIKWQEGKPMINPEVIELLNHKRDL